MTETPWTVDRIFCGVLLRLFTEAQMRDGVDPDGSHTSARAVAIIDEFEKVESAFRLPHHVAAIHAANRAEVRALISSQAPVMARLARADVEA